MSRPPSPTLTPHELDIIQILWREPGQTVSQILEKLDREPQPAYTSLLTSVRHMEKKKYLRREKPGKAHRYFPVLSANDYQRSECSRLVASLFDGNPVDAAVGFLRSENLSPSDIDRLKKAVEDLS